jgi:predicted ATPase
MTNFIKSLDEVGEYKYPNRSESRAELSLQEYTKQLKSLLDENIPPRFAGAEITSPDIQDLFKEYDLSKGMYIYGSVGTGKTRNLWGIYKTLLANKIIMDSAEGGDSKNLTP